MAWINRRWFGLPHTIGVMSAALMTSLFALGLDRLGSGALRTLDASLLQSIDFSDVLMQGMLSMLLFAGALHVDLDAVKAHRLPIGVLSLVSTAVSTALIGLSAYCLLPWVGLNLSLGYCLVFGALISPTDPIAVMKVLGDAGAPPALETVIAGESLFNDGLGVVLFTLCLSFVTEQGLPGAAGAITLFVREALGGLAFGFVLGAILGWMIRDGRDTHEAVLVTLAGVLGGYSLASWLGVSGPLAMVVAGLVVGRVRCNLAPESMERAQLDLFWASLDAILNSVLFVLMGLEVLFVPLDPVTLAAGVLVILLALLARYLTVGLPVQLLPSVFRLPRGSWRVMTWGGLRGGISIALALSLPAGPAHDVVFTLTYCIVVFSILGQGLSMPLVVRRALAGSGQRAF